MNVLEVIKKLRALADPEQNDNAHQRQAASYKAEELMAKHGITENDLRNITSKNYEDYNEADMDPLLRTMMDMWTRLDKMGLSATELTDGLAVLGAAARQSQEVVRKLTAKRKQGMRDAFQKAFGKVKGEEE